MWVAVMLSATLQAPPVFVRTAPAESLRVVRDGSGPPVVLLPGLFGSAYGFRRLTPLLAGAGFTAIVIEPLGVGGSGRPNRSDYSLTAQAARTAAVLDSLELRRVVIVAHAIGASIALRLAATRPDLVDGIVSLEGGPAEAATTAGFRRAMSFAPWIRMLGGMRLIRGQIRRQLSAASADPSWVTDDVVAGYTAGPAADLDAALIAFLRMAEARERTSLAARLGEVRCPVRLLVGAAPHQGAVPAREVALLRARVPDFRLDSLAGVGHFAQEERPQAVVEAVRAVRRSVALARR